MIACLIGKLYIKDAPIVVINVNGVGYEVHTSMNTFFNLPDVGQPITLLIHTLVREDAFLLYGFHDNKERQLFCRLIKVNGVGAKIALGILSAVSPYQFAEFIVNNDISGLVKLPGIGKKTAERLLIEMRDKLKELGVSGSNDGTSPYFSKPANAQNDAIEALVSLGYKSNQVENTIRKMDDGTMTSETLIRNYLKQLKLNAVSI